MNNVMKWLRRNADRVEWMESNEEGNWFYGEYGGRKVRYINNETYSHRIEIGDGCFDRWANSVAVIFFLDPNRSIQLQLNLGLVKAKSLKEYCTYLEIEV